MKQHDRLRRRGLKAAGALLPLSALLPLYPLLPLVLLLAACAGRSGGPAPVVTGAPPPPAQIVVERGQTLSGIAHAYHVPMLAVADANHLSPPYRILVGQELIIPGAGAAGPYGPAVAMTEPMSSPPPTSFASAPPPGAGPPPSYAAPVSRQPLAPEHSNPEAEARPPGAGGPPVALTPPPSSSLSAPATLNPPPPASTPAAAETAAGRARAGRDRRKRDARPYRRGRGRAAARGANSGRQLFVAGAGPCGRGLRRRLRRHPQ